MSCQSSGKLYRWQKIFNIANNNGAVIDVMPRARRWVSPRILFSCPGTTVLDSPRNNMNGPSNSIPIKFGDYTKHISQTYYEAVGMQLRFLLPP